MINDLPQAIKNFNKDREPGALQLKYKAMAEDAFRFFRGSCGLFYETLSAQYPFPASPAVWACGDLHIENVGSYRGSNRLVYFDINDFDEALLAPALWELGRLAASVQVAAEQIGFSRKEKAHLINTLLHYYCHTLKKGKAVSIERDTARGLIKKLVTRVAERKEYDLVKKRTSNENTGRLLITERLFSLPKQEKKLLIGSFNQWLSANAHKGLEAVDAGFRIAGTGSVGVKRYLLLVKRRNNGQKEMLVDLKEAMPSALQQYITVAQPAWQQEAERIIAIQEMMQHVSPDFLSSFQYDSKWFVVKEIQPTADKVSIAQAIKQPKQFADYVASLGILAASAQLRSSGRKGAASADELEGFGAAAGWQNAVAAWTVAYAGQLKSQYAVFKKAWKSGYFNT